jgi:hypothetical protein
VVGLTDLSDDGRDDVVALSRAGNVVRVRLGTANGALSPVSGTALASAVTAADVTFPDLDDDGAPDVAVAGWGDALQVLFGDGAGGLEDATAFPALQYSRIRSVVAGDFNEDGVDDVVVGDDYNTRMFMMRNAPLPVSPTAEIDFGEQRLGAGPATKTVELANGGVAPLDVAQVSVLGEGFGAGRDGCTGARLQYGQACSGDVTFMATEPGDYEGALELSSNAADSLLYLPLFGTGVAAPPSSPPASPTSPGAATTTPAPATGSSGPTVTPARAKSAQAIAAAAVAALRRLGLAGLARGRTQEVSVAVSAGTVTIVARTRGMRRNVIARSESVARGLRIRATARGRRLARRAKSLKLDVVVTLKPVSGPVQKASARATLVAGRRP